VRGFIGVLVERVDDMGGWGSASRGGLVRSVLVVAAGGAYVGTGRLTERAVAILVDADSISMDPLALLNAADGTVMGPVFLLAAILAAHFAGGLLCIALGTAGRASLPFVPAPSFPAAERHALRLGGGLLVAIPLVVTVVGAGVTWIGVGDVALDIGVPALVVALSVVTGYLLGVGYVASVLLPPAESTLTRVTALALVPLGVGGPVVVERALAATPTAMALLTVLASSAVVGSVVVSLAQADPSVRGAPLEWAVFAVTGVLVVAAWQGATLYAPMFPLLFAVLALALLLPMVVAFRGYAVDVTAATA
jgi:hypothetical protein